MVPLNSDLRQLHSNEHPVLKSLGSTWCGTKFSRRRNERPAWWRTFRKLYSYSAFHGPSLLSSGEPTIELSIVRGSGRKYWNSYRASSHPLQLLLPPTHLPAPHLPGSFWPSHRLTKEPGYYIRDFKLAGIGGQRGSDEDPVKTVAPGSCALSSCLSATHGKLGFFQVLATCHLHSSQTDVLALLPMVPLELQGSKKVWWVLVVEGIAVTSSGQGARLLALHVAWVKKLYPRASFTLGCYSWHGYPA